MTFGHNFRIQGPELELNVFVQAPTPSRLQLRQMQQDQLQDHVSLDAKNRCVTFELTVCLAESLL